VIELITKVEILSIMNIPLQHIETEAGLNQLCEEVQGSSWLALDTEFFRVNTYYPELCLLQVANNETLAIIDPIKISNLERIYDVIYDTSITKIFHSARQDLEIFYHLRKSIPTPLFDTQIAGGILGYDSQMGYANLAREILGVELDKSQTRTNWRRRPLSEQQINYAADDVIYLAQLYEVLQDMIKTPEQIANLGQAHSALENPEIYEPDPENMWRKIKEARNIKSETLSVLKKLAAWREVTARVENTPRKWILPDPTLVAIAKRRPSDVNDFRNIKGMDEKAIHRYSESILAIISDMYKGNAQV
jgi:ribonuclease D